MVRDRCELSLAQSENDRRAGLGKGMMQYVAARACRCPRRGQGCRALRANYRAASIPVDSDAVEDATVGKDRERLMKFRIVWSVAGASKTVSPRRAVVSNAFE